MAARQSLGRGHCPGCVRQRGQVPLASSRCQCQATPGQACQRWCDTARAEDVNSEASKQTTHRGT